MQSTRKRRPTTVTLSVSGVTVDQRKKIEERIFARGWVLGSEASYDSMAAQALFMEAAEELFGVVGAEVVTSAEMTRVTRGRRVTREDREEALALWAAYDVATRAEAYLRIELPDFLTWMFNVLVRVALRRAIRDLPQITPKSLKAQERKRWAAFTSNLPPVNHSRTAITKQAASELLSMLADLKGKAGPISRESRDREARKFHDARIAQLKVSGMSAHLAASLAKRETQATFNLPSKRTYYRAMARGRPK